jgi:hypothetical protein
MIRRKKIDNNDTRIVNNVDDLVFVMESILERTKLKNAMKGSRCCTSARIAKRMSLHLVSIFSFNKRAGLRYNCLRTLSQTVRGLRSRA